MPPRRLFLATLLFACAPALAQISDDLTEPGQLPPSTGFQNPDDISVLLDYRLPDWWSRTWTAGFDLRGFTSDFRSADDRRSADDMRLDLRTGADWERDGEDDQFQVATSLRANRYGHGASSEYSTIDSSTAEAAAYLQGSWRHYLTPRWSVLGGAGGNWTYAQEIMEETGFAESRQFRRRYSANLKLGLGWGRLRNVTPVIQAARLNERLAALGSTRLPADDVLRVAEGISRQAAYGGVFDRPDRRFWADVLAPVTARQTLTPFETYYLAESLQEFIGNRSEGFQIDLEARIDYHNNVVTVGGGEATHFASALSGQWSHNLSLDHQVGASIDVEYRNHDLTDDQVRRSTLTTARLEHLWCVAERFVWTNAVRAAHIYAEDEFADLSEITRVMDVTLDSTFIMSLEDRLSLRPSVSWTYEQWEQDDNLQINRGLTYAVGFVYDLDRTLN